MSVTELGYLGFEVSDLQAWEAFATQVVGLDVAPAGRAGLSLQIDDRAWRVILLPGPADDLAFVGWRVPDAGALSALASTLHAREVPLREISPADRGVSDLLAFDDPAGVPCEIFYGPSRAAHPFRSRRVPGGFVAGDLGLGHVVLTTCCREASEDFYREVLGLRLTDRIVAEFDSFAVDLAFLRANRRHHSLALGDSLPQRLHHFMLQYESLDDLGRAYDRANRAGVVATTLGRHPNDKMISFYVRTPSGFQLELGWGGRQVDGSDHPHPIYDRITLWGHRLGAATP